MARPVSEPDGPFRFWTKRSGYFRGMRHMPPTHREASSSRILVRALRSAVMLIVFSALGNPALAQADALSPARTLALPDDTTKVLKLSDLCFAYRRINADSARSFGETALRLAKQLHYSRGEAQAYNDLAILRIDRSDFNAADSLLRRSLVLRTQLGDSAGMAAVHNKLGIIYQARFMLEDALDENLQALRIYERIGPPAHEATLLNNIAILQFNLNRLPAALATHQRAADIRRSIGDEAGLAASLGNMANVETQLGDTAAAINNYQSAITYFREKDLRVELAVQLNNLAGIFMARDQLEQAAANYNEALAIRTEAGDRKGMASSLIGMGGTRLRQGRMAEARRYLSRGLAMARSVDARSEQMQALMDLARLYAKLNVGDSSFFFHQQYVALKDSVFNADMSERLAQAETKFETEKKELQIQVQRTEIAELERKSERRKLWLVTALGGSVLVMLVALLLVQVQRRHARARHDAAIISEREAGLRGVLEATEGERKRIARELHDGVGQQLTGLNFRLEELAAKVENNQPISSGTIKEALSISHDTGREVREIAHSMMPRALGELGLNAAMADMLKRMLGNSAISYELDHYGLEERLPVEMEVGLFRITQELVQNTLKHAQARHVDVQLLKNQGHLVLNYEDDGKGFNGARGGEGIGLRNIRERVHALRGKVTIGDGDHTGMRATIRIPLKVVAN